MEVIRWEKGCLHCQGEWAFVTGDSNEDGLVQSTPAWSLVCGQVPALLPPIATEPAKTVGCCEADS